MAVVLGGWRFSGMLLVALFGAWLGRAAAQTIDSGEAITFNIPPGSLVEAIKQFAEQADIQVTADFGGPHVQEQAVEEIRGRLTTRAALDRILNGSGLSAKWHSPRTVRIYPGPVAPHAYDNVNEVLVTGSRIGGGGEGPAPVRVYSREDIDRFGVSSLPGLAGYFTQQPFSFGEWAQRSGAQHFQMRGLGVDTTLVLINGRRAPPSATSVTLNAFDLNTIPLTAVERIEIMSDSASAIYGADAIGGVVNIILKQGIEAPDVYLHYGAAAGGADERRVAGSIGSSGERFKSSLVVDYFDRGMLLGAERDLWRNQDFRRFGGRDHRVTAGNPGNVYSLTGDPLPGLPTSQASVPVGSTGVGLRPEDFLATAGVVNLYSADRMRSVVPDVNRLSAFGSAEFSMNSRWSIFGEMLTARSDVVAQGLLPSVTRQIVPAGNPYNPFGQPVAVDFSLIGMKPVAVATESELGRFVLGARGALRRLDWELVLTRSDERVDSKRINDLDLARVAAALQSTEPQTALNPFVDGLAGSERLLRSLVGEPQQFEFFSGGLQLSGFLRGQLFRMPDGMSEFVLGGEWRREEVKSVDTMIMERERDVSSGFAEFKLPLLKKLSLKLAVRGDYYQSADNSVNPQYGLVWRPTKDWLVRTAYGTSFRPPSLLERSSYKLEFLLPVADPMRGGSVSPVRLTAGGNPDLENVSAHSFTGGVVYRANQRRGLHWGAHYWRVVMDNRIVIPRTWDVGKLEEILPDRVTRSVPTEGDRSAGWPGALESLDISLLNYGRLETSGIDLDLSYGVARESDYLRAALSASWVDGYSAEDLSSVQPLERVGIANLQGTIPEWRLVGSLTWEGKGWGTSATARFTPRYRDADLTGVLDRHLPSRTIIDMQAWLELGRLFDSDLLDNLKLTAGVLNLFDEKVDFANVGLNLGFDITQADLKQRFAYLRITRTF